MHCMLEKGTFYTFGCVRVCRSVWALTFIYHRASTLNSNPQEKSLILYKHERHPRHHCSYSSCIHTLDIQSRDHVWIQPQGTQCRTGDDVGATTWHILEIITQEIRRKKPFRVIQCRTCFFAASTLRRTRKHFSGFFFHITCTWKFLALHIPGVWVIA